MKKHLLTILAFVAVSCVCSATLWTVPSDTLMPKTVVTDVPGVTLKFMDSEYWHQTVGTASGNITPLTLQGTEMNYSWQGRTNPAPWLHGVAPVGYAMWTFDVTVPGALRVGIAVSKAKKFHVTCIPIMTTPTYTSANWVEEYTYSLLPETVTTVSSETTFITWANANNIYYGNYKGVYPGRLWNADSIAAGTATWLSEVVEIQAEAGKSYCVFCTGSKLGFFGFDFEAGGTITHNVNTPEVTATIVSSRYFTLTGTEVFNVTEGVAMPGMYIAKNKLSDGRTQTVKFMVK
jgi:hypothetical protein